MRRSFLLFFCFGISIIALAKSLEDTVLKKQMLSDNDTWYSVLGTRISGKPTSKGVYIHNNQKVFVK